MPKKKRKSRGRGRWITVKASNSRKLAELTPKALSLFFLILPHLNGWGKLDGDAYYIKAKVCKHVKWLTIEDIKSALDEINEKTDLKWFEYKGEMYLHAINDAKHNYLQMDRRGPRLELPDHLLTATTEREAKKLAAIEAALIAKKELAKKKKFHDHSREITLSTLLFELIRERNRNHRKPNLQEWARHIDLMFRIDNRDFRDVEKVIRWCQKDSFWFRNILSTVKLREKYDQLWLTMVESEVKKNGGPKPGPIKSPKPEPSKVRPAPGVHEL
ncbi:MAG: putative DNA replication protein [Prokaryotic dsDNA virus sp.]|jgi:hypothetical protein|nr:MAG: putative DNA replication protein [Prokaryotic dsDNA virus sp.]|tara:strand:+ start:4197 stop:5015 length:819 start_codon:yes stop_codon:yes gene_type:complete